MLSRLGRHCLVVSLSRFYLWDTSSKYWIFFFFSFYFFTLQYCLGFAIIFLHEWDLSICSAALALHCLWRVGAWASRGGGFFGGTQALLWASVVAVRELSDYGVQAQELWHTGLVAPRRGMFQEPGIEPCVPCTARQIPNHWATREVRFPYVKFTFF